jgi:hypothetical protein
LLSRSHHFVRFCANHRIVFAGAVLETITVEDFDEGRLGGLDRPNLDTLIYELGNVGLTIPHSSLNSAPRASEALYLTGPLD